MKKLSKRQTQRLSKRLKDPEKLILEMRARAKNDPIMIEKFKEYGIPIDEIDSISIQFVPLDVSAKTRDKKIYLNEHMLSEDSEVKDPTSYLIHEAIHFLQQRTGKNLTKNQADDYLSRPSEVESFVAQIKYKEEKEGKESSEKYVSKLLDHHNLKGKERKEKEKELLEE